MTLPVPINAIGHPEGIAGRAVGAGAGAMTALTATQIREISETYSAAEVDGLIDGIPIVDLSGYVPYTGATADLDLGAFGVTAIRGYFGAGTVAAPSITFAADTNTGIYNLADQLRFSSAGADRLALTSNVAAFYVPVRSDVIYALNNNLNVRNGTTAQAFSTYSTYTSTTSFESLKIQSQTAGSYQIGSAIGSAGGTNRDLEFGRWDSAGTWTPRAVVNSSGIQLPGFNQRIYFGSKSTEYIGNAHDTTSTGINISINGKDHLVDSLGISHSSAGTKGGVYYSGGALGTSGLVAASRQGVLCDGDSTAGLTALKVWDNDTGALVRVKNNGSLLQFDGQTADVTLNQLTLTGLVTCDGGLSDSLFLGEVHPTFAGNKQTAVGVLAKASSGSGSCVAVGYNAYATGWGSTAIGAWTRASGEKSLAISGNNTSSTGAAEASGQLSIAIGASAKATALGAIMLGAGTNSTSYSFSVGNFPVLCGSVVASNGTTPTSIEARNTYTSTTSFESLRIKANTGNSYQIGSAVGSAGGSNRDLNFGGWNAAGTFSSSLSVSTTGGEGIGSWGFARTGGSGSGLRFNHVRGVYSGAGLSAYDPEAYTSDGLNLSGRENASKFTIFTGRGGSGASVGDGGNIVFDFGRGQGTGVNGKLILKPDGGSITGVLSTILQVEGDAVFTGNISLAASTTSAASLNIPDGVAPTTPADGDIWHESDTLKYQDSTTTRTLATETYVDSAVSGVDLSGLVPYTGATGNVDLGAKTLTVRSTLYAYNGNNSFETSSWVGAGCIIRWAGQQKVGLGSGGIRLTNGAMLSFCSDSALNYPQTGLVRTGTHAVGFLSGTNAQQLSVYNTYTSSTSFETLRVKANTGSAYQIGSAIGSAGGTNRDLEFGHWNSAGTFTAGLTVGANGNLTLPRYNYLPLTGQFRFGTSTHSPWIEGGGSGRIIYFHVGDNASDVVEMTNSGMAFTSSSGTVNLYPQANRNDIMYVRGGDAQTDAFIATPLHLSGGRALSGNLNGGGVFLFGGAGSGTGEHGDIHFNYNGTVALGEALFHAKATLAASTTSAASLNIPSGVAPTAATDGDIWHESDELLYRDSTVTQTIATKQYVDLSRMYSTEEYASTASYNYFGFTTVDGFWKVNRFDVTTGAKTTAQDSNNGPGTYADLTAAWVDYLTLVYA
jgi:hypothetical protein